MNTFQRIITSGVGIAFLTSCVSDGISNIEAPEPIVINICDATTEYINFRTIFLKDGMHLIGNTPYFAQKDANGEYAFPEDSWFRYENSGVTWEARYRNPLSNELEYFTGFIGYQWNLKIVGPDGQIYDMSVDEQGNAGLINQEGICYPEHQL